MTVAVTLAGGNKFVTLMCCSDDVILGIGIGIGYWYRWRPIVLGMPRGIVLTVTVSLLFSIDDGHVRGGERRGVGRGCAAWSITDQSPPVPRTPPPRQ